MRHTHAGALLLLFFSAAPAAAQVSGGDRGTPTTTTEATVFRNRNFLRFGSLSASGDYGKLPAQTGFVYYTESAIKPVFDAGAGASSGFQIDYGRLTYLNVDVHPQVGIGIDFAISGGYMQIDWEGIYETSELETDIGELLMDVRIGPAVSFNPINKLLLEASLKIGVGMVGGSELYIGDYPLANGSRVTVSDLNETPGFGMSRSFGIGARWGVLMLGWEARSLGATRTRNYAVNDFSGAGQSADFDYDLETKASSSAWYFGLAF